jgi:hypothetical protein
MSTATEFEDGLTRLVSSAMPAAAPLMPGKEPDEDLAGTMVAELANSLGLVIAFVARGDAKTTDTLLEAVTARVYESAAHHSENQGKLARMMRREP